MIRYIPLTVVLLACNPSASEFADNGSGVGDACDPTTPCPEDLRCQAGRCVRPSYQIIDARAYFSEGTVRYRVEIADPEQELGVLRIQVGGEVVAEGESSEWWFADEPSQRFVFNYYTPVSERPDALRVLTDDDDVVVKAPIVDQIERPVGEICLRTDPAERCASGSLCLPASATCEWPCATGTCRPVEVRAREAQTGLIVDLQADIGITHLENEAFTIDSREITPRSLSPLERPESRWIGDWPHWIEGPVAVRHRGNIIAPPIEVEARAARALGAPCDPIRIRDYCADAACIEETCRVPTAPIIDEAVVVHQGDAAGLWVRGRDPDNDVTFLRVEAGGVARMTSRFSEYRDPWATRRISVAGGTFEYLISGRSMFFSDDAWGPATVLVRDLEGLTAEVEVETIEDPLTGRPNGAAGDVCDRAHMLFPCAEGLRCDRRDDAPDAPLACHAEEPECPPGLATPLSVGQIVTIDDTFAALETFPICIRNHGANDPRRSNYFSFIAPDAGQYRVRVDAQGAFGLTVRRACLLPFTEIVCGGFEVVHDPPAFDTADLELDADERITIVVGSSGDFRIIVDAL